MDPLDTVNGEGRGVDFDLSCLMTISMDLAWFNLRLLIDAQAEIMVKFRESAVNAGSRNQQVAVISIFEETVSNMMFMMSIWRFMRKYKALSTLQGQVFKQHCFILWKYLLHISTVSKTVQELSATRLLKYEFLKNNL